MTRETFQEIFVATATAVISTLVIQYAQKYIEKEKEEEEEVEPTMVCCPLCTGTGEVDQRMFSVIISPSLLNPPEEEEECEEED